jgi:NAD(P)-dependent dehydrogenase (short-subunit alcohol dehydrogenase family)
MLAYSASKAAVIGSPPLLGPSPPPHPPGLTKAVGKEYAETGITCNAVAPAVVRTAMVDAMPDSQVKYMTGILSCCLVRLTKSLFSASDKIPMKRCGGVLPSYCNSRQLWLTGGRNRRSGCLHCVQGGGLHHGKFIVTSSEAHGLLCLPGLYVGCNRRPGNILMAI